MAAVKKNIEPEQPEENTPEVEQTEIPPSVGEIIFSEERAVTVTEEQTLQ